MATRRRFAIYDWSPSMTKQSFMDETDINLIVARALKGHDVSGSLSERVAQFGDVSDVPSYQEALDLVNRANGLFMSMEAHVRSRFSNDPALLLAFLEDPRNREEAVMLGLVKPAEPAVVAPEVPVSAARASSDAKSTKAKPVGD